jgi:acetolactate synthase-1/3 small subunit
MEKNFLISAIVEHKPGVLHKIANMFSRRGFNIDSLSVGETVGQELARMTITIKGDEPTAEQLIRQLGKLIDVINVTALDPQGVVERELALIKLKLGTPEDRSTIMDYTNIFRGRIVDVATDSVIVEITGTPDKMNAFINLTSRFGIVEIARTGITALSRGPASIAIENKGEERW